MVIRVTENVSPINVAVVHTELIPLFCCIHFLKVGILLKIVIPSYEQAVLIESNAAVAAINKVR